MTLPIENDGNAMSEDMAAEAFLKKFLPAEETDAPKEPSDAGDTTKPESTDEDVEHEADESGESPDQGDEEDGDEGEGEPKRKYADDDATYVKIQEGDKEHEVPVKDLKRLWGQEAALTRKSQEVADRRKALDTEAAKSLAVTQAMLKRAQDRAAPYAQLDFLALSRNSDISDAELTALRQEAQAAFEDVQFLSSELDGFMSLVQHRQNQELEERAVAAVKELTGPADKGGIEGWNEKLYDDIRSFAVTSGAPKEVINSLVEPWAIRLLHKAMLYDRGRSKANVVTTKVKKTPTKVVKTTMNPQATKAAVGDKSKDAMVKLKQKGTTDAAADVFLTRFLKDSDD